MNPIQQMAKLYDQILDTYMDSIVYSPEDVSQRLFDIYHKLIKDPIITEKQFEHICDGTSKIKNPDRIQQLEQFIHLLQNYLNKMEQNKQDLKNVFEFDNPIKITISPYDVTFTDDNGLIVRYNLQHDRTKISYPILHANIIESNYDEDSGFYGFIEDQEFDNIMNAYNHLRDDENTIQTIIHNLMNIADTIDIIREHDNVANLIEELANTAANCVITFN